MFMFLQMAWAGVPLVYDSGTAESVSAWAAQGAGLPVSQFDPVPLETLLKNPAQTMGMAVLRHCAGSPSHAMDLLANGVRAEAAWQAGDVAGAMDQLDLGIGGLGCLSDRVEPQVAGRMFFLRGGLLAKKGDMDAAHAEMRTAFSFLPLDHWPDTFPSEGAAVFQEVLAETQRVHLKFLPAEGGALPSVDGQPLSAEGQLRSGLHLLQIPSTAGLRSAWLTIDGEAWVVIPGNYRPPILGRLLESGQEEAPAALILSTLDQNAYVASSGGLWLVEGHDLTLTITPIVRPSAPTESSPAKRGCRSKDR